MSLHDSKIWDNLIAHAINERTLFKHEIHRKILQSMRRRTHAGVPQNCRLVTQTRRQAGEKIQPEEILK